LISFELMKTMNKEEEEAIDQSLSVMSKKNQLG